MLRLCMLFIALFAASRVDAHSTPNSVVLLDFDSTGVRAELRLPVSELEQVIDLHATNVDDYLLQHVRAKTRDGADWTVQVTALHVATEQEPAELIAKLWMQPPPGAPVRSFDFNYDVIDHELINHFALVSIRSDWEAGKLAGEPELVGVMRFMTRSISVEREGGSWTRGFAAVFAVGMRHIADGTDHLMFLLALLLPAPLLASSGRWARRDSIANSLSRLLRIVTAFTIGHSATLVVGAMGWLTLPSQPVELLIACSILVSAVHAFRPIFPNREAYVAAGFGLVHGLAFASAIAELALSPGRAALSILGFNVGIEVMQLVVVLAIMPSLFLLSRTRYYALFRVAGAAFAAIAATGWVAQRAFGTSNWVEPFAEYPRHHPLIFAGVLAVVALAAFVTRERGTTRAAVEAAG